MCDLDFVACRFVVAYISIYFTGFGFSFGSVGFPLIVVSYGACGVA